MGQIVWLRNDLRLDDNPALYNACKAAIRRGEPVTAIYCLTPEQWLEHGEGAAKLGFRRDALNTLADGLAQLGIPLVVLQCERFSDIGAEFERYCRENAVQEVWFNREIPLDEQRRDQVVAEVMDRIGVGCHPQDADMLVANLPMNQQGYPYRVFTPWYRAWVKALSFSSVQPLPIPPAVTEPIAASSVPTDFPGAGEYRADLWPATEKEAQARLRRFSKRLFDYADRRDYPGINGTSTLSPYLASGLVSVRRCAQVVQQVAAEQGRDWRESDWLRELGWREFYRYLMCCFPKLCKGEPFKTEAESGGWRCDPALIEAWQKGLTGFPIIDAAMRQLYNTGWMHNRLRMLTASFFTKLMLQDWRLGEAYFMSQLIDGDFASNNGGWQWSASTGCDASPWFRIFNPIRQSRQFDADGHFIRKLIPELAGLDNKHIHNPTADQRRLCDYPSPMLDYKIAREHTLSHFKTALAAISV